MGLVVLRKSSQCFIGPVFTAFEPPSCVINSKKVGVIVNNCMKER